MSQAPLVDGLEKDRVTLGFIPLTDCAPLVIAREKGFFAAQGLDVTLSKETSWANIRDKVAIGVLDGAHMLAPMPLGSSLGIGPIAKPMVAAFSFGMNGNAVTVSQALYQDLVKTDPQAMRQRPLGAAALRRLIERRREQGLPKLTLGIVFPVSSHNYQLRYWLAAAGIHPDRDLRLEVVPPSQMVGRLREGRLDGFCVGEPWNSMAVREGIGRVLITGYEIWNASPEKVLGVNEEWADQHPRTHRALIHALLQAAVWLDAPENRPEAVELISRGSYVNAPADVVRMSLNGTFQYARNEFPHALPDFYLFHRHAANFPWRSHALWLLSQMLRWGQIDTPLDLRAVAQRVYRSDLTREVALEAGLSMPVSDYKTEGGHEAGYVIAGTRAAIAMGRDRFLDAALYSPADPVDYLEGMPVHNLAVDLESLRSVNPPWDQARCRHLLADQGGPERQASGRP